MSVKPVALITGASRGIGKALAKKIAEEFRVIGTSRSLNSLKEVGVEIVEQGGEFVPIQLELPSPQDLSKLIESLEETHGPIDLLINNAGVAGPNWKEFWGIEEQDWWRVMEVNVRGPFQLSQVLINRMKERGRGRIINVASNAGIQPLGSDLAYEVSKTALIRLGETMAGRVKDFGIKVFNISPGLVLTDMSRPLKAIKDLDSYWESPDKAAELCLKLASGDFDFLSGRYLHATSSDLDFLAQHRQEVEEGDFLTLRLKEFSDKN